MIKKNRLTVLIRSEHQDKTGNVPALRRLTFPKRVISYLFLFGVLLAALGSSGFWTLRENLMIRSKISALEADIAEKQDVYSRISEIRKEVRIIRDFLGKETYDQVRLGEKQLGMGGSDPDETLVLSPLEMETEIERLDRAEMKKPLHDQVTFLKSSVGEVHTLLLDMTEKLSHKPTILPAKGNRLWISSGFGWRKSPFTGLRKFHYGLDISGKKGTPILTTADGKVEKIGYNKFIGNYVTILHDETYSTTYGHLLKENVVKGQAVRRGDVIGFMGSTGLSTGNHVHYVVRVNGKRVNPYDYVLNRKSLNIAASVE